MRNHLNSRTQIVPAPFLFDNALIETSGGNIILLRAGAAREPLIMSKVQIRLCTVVSDKDFAMLIGTHRPWINVEVGVEFPQTYLVATRL